MATPLVGASTSPYYFGKPPLRASHNLGEPQPRRATRRSSRLAGPGAVARPEGPRGVGFSRAQMQHRSPRSLECLHPALLRAQASVLSEPNVA
jgi:hypothetical protein